MLSPNRRRGVRWVVALAAVLTLGFVGWSVAANQGWLAIGPEGPKPHDDDPYKNLALSGCNPAVLPAGQAFPSGEPEPLWPAWCYKLKAMPVTRVAHSNSWIDEFDTNKDMGRLEDGDLDYRVFEDIDHRDSIKSRAFVNQNHWMVDTAEGSNGGVLIRPDRSFRFENGRLIVEADVAAAIPAYSDSASVEIDVTTAPAPTDRLVDLQYGYGLFGGHWTFGCRFQADRQMTCSLFNASGSPGDAVVFGNELGRVWQMLPFQHVGKVNSGGEPSGENADYFRRCADNQMDLYCRDRFRLELTKDSVKAWVNGRLYFEQSGIEPKYQLPDELIGSDLYVYFTSWVNRPLESSYRFHWDRLAVNPRDSSGAEVPATPGPAFGLMPLHESN